jgi:hypothetical protein
LYFEIREGNRKKITNPNPRPTSSPSKLPAASSFPNWPSLLSLVPAARALLLCSAAAAPCYPFLSFLSLPPGSLSPFSLLSPDARRSPCRDPPAADRVDRPGAHPRDPATLPEPAGFTPRSSHAQPSAPRRAPAPRHRPAGRVP